MRKQWLILPGIAAMLAIATLLVFSLGDTPSASADNFPHVKNWGATADGCASCHRAHRGQDALLLKEDQATLCESCHDGTGSALDVIDGSELANPGGATLGALRGGGFSYARIDSDDPTLRSPSKVGTAESGSQCGDQNNDGVLDGVDDDLDGTVDDGCPTTIVALASASATRSSHSVDGSPQTIWGYGDITATDDPGHLAFDLSCGNCHDPHGNGNYRILRPVPAGLLHYGDPLPAFMPDMAGRLTDESPIKTYTITDYWNVDYTDQWVDSGDADALADTETTGRQVGRWCTTCHSRYLAPSGSWETDSGDAIFAYRHTSDPEGRDSHGRTTPVTLSGSCLKCHVAHGTNASAGAASGAVENPDGSAGDGANDSRLLKMNNRGVCQKCHNK